MTNEVKEIDEQMKQLDLHIPKREPGLILVPTGETCIIEGRTYRILELVRELRYS